MGNPIQRRELTLLDTRYQTGKLDHEYPAEGIGFKLPDKYGLGKAELIVRLFHKEGNAIYSLFFHDVGAFRLLDENGLDEVWRESSNQGGRPAQSTFKVRNHLWQKESPLSFSHYAKDDWSFLIATDWECLEIVCSESPDIRLEETVLSRPLRQ